MLPLVLASLPVLAALAYGVLGAEVFVLYGLTFTAESSTAHVPLLNALR